MAGDGGGSGAGGRPPDLSLHEDNQEPLINTSTIGASSITLSTNLASPRPLSPLLTSSPVPPRSPSLGVVGVSDCSPSTSAVLTTLAASSPQPPQVADPADCKWVEMCDRLGGLSADHFFKSICSTLLTEPGYVGQNVTATQVLQRYITAFSNKIEKHLADKKIELSSNLADHVTPKQQNGSFSDYSDQEPESPFTLKPRPFFRKFSFRGITKGKTLNIFHKQGSDEVELSASSSTPSHPAPPSPAVHGGPRPEKKGKSAKIVVDCYKEGSVNFIAGDAVMDDPASWEKCKLVLVRAAGGFMLEFYSPPKASKAKTGLFCCLITEARETTALEMPDKENTFVLKANNNQEFVMEAPDVNSMRCWLNTIEACMRCTAVPPLNPSLPSNGQTGGLPMLHPLVASDHVDSTCSDRLLRLTESQSMQHFQGSGRTDFLNRDAGHPVSLSDLPPRLAGELGAAVRSNHGSASSINAAGECDLFHILVDYPWFHGTLSRSDAAAMVLHHSVTGHGIFLGRAKHLRLTLNADGQCRVQHLWFNNIFDLLEHFRLHPIPLESGGSSECTLSEYVVRLEGVQNASSFPSMGPVDRALHSLPEPNEVVTLGGSLRRRIGSLEVLNGDGNSSGGSGGGRAKENTYSFV